MAARPDSRVEEKIIDGKYLFTKKVLGKGRFGKVFMGKQLQTGADLALKVTKADALNLGEVKELKKLKNTENVVRLIEEYQNDKYFILVLEYCNGGDFSRKNIVEALRGNEVLCRRYFGQLLCGLKAITDKKLLHRDLKPANLLLHGDIEKDGILKIADLGFAKTVGAAGLLESKVGTPLYESPERLEGKEYGISAEMWAAGCILYEWLTGRTAFGGVQSPYQLTRLLQQEGWRPSFDNIQCSEEVRDLVNRLIVVEPSERLTITQAREHPWLTGVIAPVAGGGGQEPLGAAPSATGVALSTAGTPPGSMAGSLGVVLTKKDRVASATSVARLGAEGSSGGVSIDSMEVSPPSNPTQEAPMFPKSPLKHDAGTSPTTTTTSITPPPTFNDSASTASPGGSSSVVEPTLLRKFVDPVKSASSAVVPPANSSPPPPPVTSSIVSNPSKETTTTTSNSSFSSNNNNNNLLRRSSCGNGSISSSGGGGGGVGLQFPPLAPSASQYHQGGSHPIHEQRASSSAPPPPLLGENVSLASFNNNSSFALSYGGGGPPAHVLALEHAKTVVSVSEVQADAVRQAVLLGYAAFILNGLTGVCDEVKKLFLLVRAQVQALQEGPDVYSGAECPNPSSILVSYAIKIGEEAAHEEGFKNRFCGSKNESIHEVYRHGLAALHAAALNPDLNSRETDKITYLSRKFEVRIRATS